MIDCTSEASVAFGQSLGWHERLLHATQEARAQLQRAAGKTCSSYFVVAEVSDDEDGEAYAVTG